MNHPSIAETFPIARGFSLPPANLSLRAWIRTTAVMALTLATQGLASADYFVSPDGSDQAPGDKEHPFRSIERARNAVREIHPKPEHDLHVWIAPGTYVLEKLLTFTEEDSGTEKARIIYEGTAPPKPVLLGGTRVTGWNKAGGNLWQAPLSRACKLRVLYIDGQPVPMASMMARGRAWGTFEVKAGEAPWAWASGKRPDGTSFNAAEVPDIQSNQEDVEIVNFALWNLNIACVREVTRQGNARIFKFQQPYGAIAQTCGWANFNPGGNLRIQNAREFLKEPGTFYFDRAAQTLFYLGKEGEDLTKKTVIAPRLERIIHIRGSSPENRVHDLVFRNLKVSGADWNLMEVEKSSGLSTVQGNNALVAFCDGRKVWHEDLYRNLDVPPGMVEIEHADRVLLERNVIENGGACGISLPNDANGIGIVGNVIRHTAGSAICIGHPQHIYENVGPDMVSMKDGLPTGVGIEKEKYPPALKRVCRHNRVMNNFIYACPREFGGQAGVMAYMVEDLRIEHNVLDRLPFNGVSLGWSWDNFNGGPGSVLPGRPTNLAKNNTVSFNRFFHFMEEFDDSGAIYTLGSQPGTTIDGNYMKEAGSVAHPTIKRYVQHRDAGSAFISTTNTVCDVAPDIWTLHAFTWGGQHDLVTKGFYTTSAVYTNPHNPNVLDDYFWFPDNHWPLDAFKIVQSSGLEPGYLDIIPPGYAAEVDLLLPVHVQVQGKAELPLPARKTIGGEVWLAPAGTTKFVDGPAMSRASSGATSILAPMKDGEYRLYLVKPEGAPACSRCSVFVKNTPPQVRGVEERETYQQPVAPTYPGSGYLDGGLISSGDVVVQDGGHQLKVVEASGLSTTVNFTLETKLKVIRAESGRPLSNAALVTADKRGGVGQCVGRILKEGDGVEFSNLPSAKRLYVMYSAEQAQPLRVVLNGKDAGELPLQFTQGLMMNQDRRYKTAVMPLQIPEGATLALVAKQNSNSNQGAVLVAIYLE